MYAREDPCGIFTGHLLFVVVGTLFVVVGTWVAMLRFHADAVCFSADSKRIAWTYVGGGYAAEVADVNTKKMVAHIPLPAAGHALDFSPDGTQLAIGNKDTTIGLWDLSKMAVVPADSDAQP